VTDQNRRPILGYVNLNVFRGGMILNKNLLDENVCARSHALLCHSRVLWFSAGRLLPCPSTALRQSAFSR
jgi:hypothetical protein